MRIGARVKITKGNHKGKMGTIVNTRGSHVSKFVLVQLERLIQGHACADQSRPSDSVGISISSIEYEK